MQLPISRSLWPILHRFWLWDTATYWLKIAYFSYPSHWHARWGSLPMFLLEFRAEVNQEETRVMGLSASEDRMIVAWVILTQCPRVTDERTDGQTDGFTIASTALCWVCWRAVIIRMHAFMYACMHVCNILVHIDVLRLLSTKALVDLTYSIDFLASLKW